MACVTLKRPLEFDPIHFPECSPRHKRRRCMPLCPSPSSKTYSAHYDKIPLSALRSSINNGQLTRLMKENIDQLKAKGIIIEKDSLPTKPLVDIGPESSAIESDSTTVEQATAENSVPALYSDVKKVPSPDDTVKFSFTQVVEMCWRLLRESDSNIMAQYSEELRVRKCEQYDQFLRFVTQEYFESAPSHYVS